MTIPPHFSLRRMPSPISESQSGFSVAIQRWELVLKLMFTPRSVQENHEPSSTPSVSEPASTPSKG
ncbi:hypothetical protein TWF481_009332 [Arthrobotrys musiformis]|uniref:Uncharacterized protein n=1 Tax=Arthrobotrys musiformis TaxID=47236 RepID=A0AAV9W3G1_9PEZI